MEDILEPISIVFENDIQAWNPVEESDTLSSGLNQDYQELILDKLAPMKEQDLYEKADVEDLTVKNVSSNATEILSSEELIYFIPSLAYESGRDYSIIENIQDMNYKNLDKLTNYSFDSRYVCSMDGIVYRLKYMGNNKYTGIPMRPFITRDGYIEYVLTNKSGTKSHIQGQRIVAGLYLDKPDGKDYVDHINGNRADNRVENLEWVTSSENQRRTWLEGKKRRTGINTY